MPNKILITALVLLTLILSSCRQAKTEAASSGVESLQEHYALLMSESRLWKGDAYLSGVKFDFEERGRKIYASFQSPTNDHESLQLVFSPKTNQVTREVFQHQVPILFHEPIAQSDWKLDSVDAVEVFLSFDDIRILWMKTPNKRCNHLGLRHFFVNDQWVLAWILTISDCRSVLEYFYIDPLSGERLNLIY